MQTIENEKQKSTTERSLQKEPLHVTTKACRKQKNARIYSIKATKGNKRSRQTKENKTKPFQRRTL